MSPLGFDVLRIVSAERFHSGAALARALGASRSAVLRALRELEDLGVEVVKARGQGFRLAAPYDWLDAAALEALLGIEARRFQIELHDVCASTSTLLGERSRAGVPSASVIACELQTAGRGRRGNAWLAALGGSLTFSLLWRFERGAAGLSGLSLAAGVALVRALASVGAKGVQLKWPNDLLHAGRKLGGILIETQGAATGPCAAVIGIGINMRLPASVRAMIDQPVTDVASVVGSAVQRNRLFAGALLELRGVLDLFAREGFAPLRDEWIACHAHQDKAVTLTLGVNQMVAGRALGVADDGALLIETARGVERHLSGELTLRADA